MNHSHLRLLFAPFAALAAIACGCAPAIAADEYLTHSVKVSFADLNLATEAGAATLYERIQSAARKVCAPEPGERPLQWKRDWKICYNTAVTHAVGKVNNPLLTALHSSKALAGSTRVASTTRPGTTK